MDVDNYLRFILALVFVLGLIGVLAMIVRKYGPGRMVTGRRAGSRRLWVSEVLPLDGRRRLVLVRRDDVEHLVLLGHGADVVVETGISASEEEAEDRAPATPPSGPIETFKSALGLDT